MVGEVALGVNEDGGDALERGFFQQDDAQTGFTRPGHTNDDAMGNQVLGIIKSEFVWDDFAFIKIVGIAKVKIR